MSNNFNTVLKCASLHQYAICTCSSALSHTHTCRYDNIRMLVFPSRSCLCSKTMISYLGQIPYIYAAHQNYESVSDIDLFVNINMHFSFERHLIVFLIFVFLHFFLGAQGSIAADYNDNNSLNQKDNKFFEEQNYNSKYSQSKEMRNYFQECYMKRLKLSCITEKASLAVENSMDMDLQLIPGKVQIFF